MTIQRRVISSASGALLLLALGSSALAQEIVTVSIDLLHDKFMLIDESTLATGSANFSTAAVQYNHENAIVIKALGETPQFIASYRDRFESMWADEFADFNGSFVDWVPQGTCQ